jgi:hypothetical protein
VLKEVGAGFTDKRIRVSVFRHAIQGRPWTDGMQTSWQAGRCNRDWKNTAIQTLAKETNHEDLKDLKESNASRLGLCLSVVRLPA